MAMVVNDKERKGEKQLGVLYDHGKVRRRREWRGLKDTLYDYTRWLYLLSILAKVTLWHRRWLVKLAAYLAFVLVCTASHA